MLNNAQVAKKWSGQSGIVREVWASCLDTDGRKIIIQYL